MDGNGRWAESKKRQRVFGHEKGAQTAKKIISKCAKMPIPYLSLFTLSTENIGRKSSEVSFLRDLFEHLLVKESAFLNEENIKLHTLGDLSFFSSKTQTLLEKLKKETEKNTGMNLILDLNYGGRWEIITGIKNWVRENPNPDTEQLTEKSFAGYLPSSQFPDPDLIIRSGGETRLSNFYLWSAAYAELYFTDVLWPDFSEKDLDLAIKKYLNTSRKFGVL